MATWFPAGVRLACERSNALLGSRNARIHGRALARRGEVVFAIDVEGGDVVLEQASSWTITGSSPRPSSWRYLLQLDGPTGSRTRKLPATSVLHLRYQWDSRRPWEGLSPARGASSTSRLCGGIENQLGNEAAGVSGYILSVPDQGHKGQGVEDPPVDPLDSLRSDLAKAGSTRIRVGKF